ncbi:hypothetical protein [Ornithinibacillus californiensis]|uniref:hypothetical protein n=1 Tax=Ornithinibacillus californiensis TaxID=161536 RepID=UPI00069E8D80|nr:hypothetical protein [Ornithinibacillus californiensis]
MKRNIYMLSLTAGIAIAILTIMFYSQAGKTSNVQVSIGDSSKFTEKEINEAVDAVKKKFRSFEGCELTDLWYSEAESDRYSRDYLTYGKGSDDMKDENVIVLLSNFIVDASGGDGSFNPNSTYVDWQWILVRDSKSDKWRVDDWGY